MNGILPSYQRLRPNAWFRKNNSLSSWSHAVHQYDWQSTIPINGLIYIWISSSFCIVFWNSFSFKILLYYFLFICYICLLWKKIGKYKKSITKGKKTTMLPPRDKQTINIMACFLGEFLQAYFFWFLPAPASEMLSLVVLPTKENPCCVLSECE